MRNPSFRFLTESSEPTEGSTPRIDDIVADFSKLPPEIVQGVLDDMPLRAILGLAQHHHHDGEMPQREAYSRLLNDEVRRQASYFDSCVLSHLHLQPIFQNLSDFARLSSIWSVYSTGEIDRFKST